MEWKEVKERFNRLRNEPSETEITDTDILEAIIQGKVELKWFRRSPTWVAQAFRQHSASNDDLRHAIIEAVVKSYL